MSGTHIKGILAALGAGVIFGVGLIVGGMTQPAKVIGFLDVTGAWDPSLAFVMGGAIAVFMPLLRLMTRRRKAPVLGASFAMPTRSDLDGRLLLGAALFGIGWGTAGYCPGPAITSLGTLAPSSLLFFASMFAGFGLKRAYDEVLRRRALAPSPVATSTTPPSTARGATRSS